MTSFDAASSSETALVAMLDAIAAEVTDKKTIVFDGNDFTYEKSMLVDKEPYGSVEEAVSEVDLGLSTVTKVLLYHEAVSARKSKSIHNSLIVSYVMLSMRLKCMFLFIHLIMLIIYQP